MTKKKILDDHKKIGNKLYPPLSTAIGSSDFSYVKLGIPQIIWLSLLNKNLGLKQGTQIALDFAQAIQELKIKEEIPYYISWFSNLDDKQYVLIKNKLKEKMIFDKLNIALSDLLNVYPLCPLCKIFKSETLSKSNILIIKDVLISIYDKYSKESTFSLANAIYLLGACGKLRIEKGSSLTDLPKLIDYPNTEQSKMIASFVRATSIVLLSSNTIENHYEWMSYFWNRGIEIEPSII